MTHLHYNAGAAHGTSYILNNWARKIMEKRPSSDELIDLESKLNYIYVKILKINCNQKVNVSWSEPQYKLLQMYGQQHLRRDW